MNLLTQYYIDKSEARQSEIDYCITANIRGGYQSLTLFCDSPKAAEKAANKFRGCDIRLIKRRPIFNDYFDLIESDSKFWKGYNIICNSDIFFPYPQQINHAFQNHKDTMNLCLALSRWDFFSDTTVTPFHRADSQDAWIFDGRISKNLSANFGMGEAGCDNALAYLLEKAGYTPLNLCNEVYAYHYHESGVRNYLGENNEPTHRVPPPYKLLNPQ